MTPPTTPWSDEAAAVEVLAERLHGESIAREIPWAGLGDGQQGRFRRLAQGHLTALEPYIPGSGELLGGEVHRVEIEFDGFGPSIKLLHPEGGCSLPEGVCEECGRDLQDPKSKSCIGCDVMVPGWCWVQDWVENDGYELLHGKVTLPVEPEWDGDSARLHLQQPQQPVSGLDNGQVERLREALEVAVLGLFSLDERRSEECAPDLTADEYAERGLVETGQDFTGEGFCRLSEAGAAFILDALSSATPTQQQYPDPQLGKEGTR